LVLLDARVVTIDGRQFQQLTFRVKNDAPSRPGHDGVTLARYEGVEADQAWREVEQGSVFTDTILDLEPGTARKPTLVITAAGAETAEERLEQDAALELLLSTMRLPE
jgi:hypothetical protein